MLTDKAAIAANRFGLGAKPADARSIGRDHADWLLAQLDAHASAAARDAASRPATPASAAVLMQVRELRLVQRVMQRRGGSARAPAAPGIEVRDVVDFAAFLRGQYAAQMGARHRAAIATDAPFVERLVHFWSNHFAVSIDKQPLAAIAGLYEQEAIRPHVTGNFYDLLLAAERHPAMILYLDNAASMGPASAAARLARAAGRELGLNENLAREILELHTLGVDGGYTQRDVTELAKIITGWSIGGPVERRGNAPDGASRVRRRGDANARRAAAELGLDAEGRPGEFHFRAVMHEPGAKTLLGRTFGDGGLEEGEEALRMLARHPSTARHLATKLARHFVHDDPPAALVERLAETYLDNDGELTPVYRALVAANESWRQPFAKYKTPQDYVISAYRGLGIVPDDPQPVLAALGQLGQRPFAAGSPAGWPDTAAHWNGADALLKRIEWAAELGRTIGDRADPVPVGHAVLGPLLDEHTATAIARAESRAQGLGLLLASPEFQRR